MITNFVFMEILIIVMLLILNGVFAMYEIALVSSNKMRLTTLVENGNKSAKGVLKQLEEPEKFLSAIQIGITLIGIISGAYGGVALAGYLDPLFSMVPWLAPYTHDLSVATVVILITYFSLVIGELVPKSMALSNPERYATLLSPIMILLTKIVYPFVLFLSVSTKFFNRILGITSQAKSAMTHEELQMLLRQSSEEGVIDKEESEMLKDVFRFSDKKASELMTHRKEVIYFTINSTRDEVLQIIQKAHFSKYLLLGDSSEQIIGIVTVKDMLPLFEQVDIPFDLKSIASEPLFIPDCLQARKVLELFKSQKRKLGIVVDEYGDMEGIITLHDLAECIMGNVLDENEQEEPDIVFRADGTLLVEGSMSISDFMDEMKIFNYDDVKDKDFSTLGGLAMYMVGRIPKCGDLFTYRHFQFEVVDMDNGRVDKLLVRNDVEKTQE